MKNENKKLTLDEMAGLEKKPSLWARMKCYWASKRTRASLEHPVVPNPTPPKTCPRCGTIDCKDQSWIRRHITIRGDGVASIDVEHLMQSCEFRVQSKLANGLVDKVKRQGSVTIEKRTNFTGPR